ncbi:LysR family transcriptional regulator [Phycicoccus flavus]|uniref:LysR family transcriptional regulator n=1 Tax=Phycicoccus flavus TaxID=2502783 RepID=UPI000FEB944C|nr:LysR family transcriptional regulator [Phycicoccus flavus]NHA66481.1 LysR family transcriptional regulator [Phycicoccus flavus]
MIDRRLHVLRMVAQCGTVTGAAEALDYTPSAVSQQLRGLARDLGVELLVQDGRRVRLTPAARVLLERSEELLTRWEEIRAEVSAAAEGGGGLLRLCGFSTAAAALLPPAAAALRDRMPGCTVRIIEAEPDECFALLLADQADVAVVVATPGLPATSEPRFALHHLLDDPLDVLLPSGHALAAEPAVPLRDLGDEAWIMDRPGRPYSQLLQTACAAAGFTPSVAHHAAEWDTGAALVGAGLGIALVPRLAHIPDGYAVVRVPLSGDPVPSRRILTGVRRGSDGQPAVAAALAVLQDLAAGDRD